MVGHRWRLFNYSVVIESYIHVFNKFMRKVRGQVRIERLDVMTDQQQHRLPDSIIY